jgi:Mrp family chromosome partitioning ATPase/capsular polysaccharide biosynthesis protein
VYEAKTRLLVGPSLDSASPDLNSLKIGGQLIQTYADLVNTRPFLESVDNKLDRKVDLNSLGGMIDSIQNPDTRILTLIVHNSDPKQAVAIANAAAATLVEMSPSKDNTAALLRTQMSNQSHQLEQIISDAEASIQKLEAELLALGSTGQQNPDIAQNTSTPKSIATPLVIQVTPGVAQNITAQQNLIIQQLDQERTRLSDALRTLAIVYQVLLDTNTNQVEMIEPAGIATASLVNQNIPLKTATSGFAGLILAVGIVIAFEYFDDTIRYPGELTGATKAPALVAIEKHSRVGKSGLGQVVTFNQPQSRAANSYRMAVAKLLFSFKESIPHTFFLSSLGSRFGDDTAATVVNLAVGFAQAGNRVVLLDAQFHKPILTKLFDADDKAGLSDLLASNSTKLQLLPVKDVPGIRFLPAGLSSEKDNGGAAVNFDQFTRVLEEIQKDADIVLVAGSPISWFAESLTLASLVNGVILVARRGEAHGKKVRDVIDDLAAMNIPVIGAIFDHNSSPFAIARKDRASMTRVANVISKKKAELIQKPEQTAKS